MTMSRRKKKKKDAGWDRVRKPVPKPTKVIPGKIYDRKKLPKPTDVQNDQDT